MLSSDLIGVRKIPLLERFGIPKKKKDGSDGKVILFPDLDNIQRDLRSREDWIDYSCYDAQSTWELYQVMNFIF